MLFWYFLVIVALIWLLFATITDIKKKEVPDWLNYSLVIIGLGSRLIYSLITWDFSYILFGLLGFVVFFVFAHLMYYTKQWGGGDSKLLMGLGAMFGNYEPIFNGINLLPFLVTLLINIFVAGTLYGILYSLFLGVRNWNKFATEFRKRNFMEVKIIGLLIFVLIIVIYFVFSKDLSYLIILLLLLLFLAFVLLQLIKIVEDSSLYKLININQLTEGDWLVNDIAKNGKIICKVRNIGLTKKDIVALKKAQIKKVLVKEGIPFVPGFLIGFLISIMWGDVLAIMVAFF